jgi:ABC-type Na+ transport system ATPase subunit NatA
MIEVKGLHKSFGAKRAVDGVSFCARDGEITGLLGPNGAGKTTTLRMLYTLMRPDAGSVLIDGIDAVREPLAVRRTIGVLPDARGLYKRLTARENIEYFAALQRADRHARHAGDRGPAHRGLLAGRARQDGDRARAGARAEERAARRADQWP